MKTRRHVGRATLIIGKKAVRGLVNTGRTYENTGKREAARRLRQAQARAAKQ